MDVVGALEPAGAPRGEERRRWHPRATLTPEHRRRVVGSLFPESSDVAHWWFRFAVMLSLSVVIAVLGLSLDSSAIVIGAMLIAPLMTPVLGISAGLVMAWPRRTGSSMLAVAVGTAGAVGIAWAVTSVLPASDRVLTAEVLARTSPDLLDLLVALAAGAAGAYATARADVSAALPGVAVAVALVPPLAATGFTLAIGRVDLAGGAVLLFTANLVAIVLAGALVFIASGFVPPGRLRVAPGRIRAGLLATVLATTAVSIPLAIASLKNASRAQNTRAVNQAVVTWLTPYPALKLSGVSIDGARVTVDLVGSTAPPATPTLVSALTGILGPRAAVQVQWFQSSVVAPARPAAPAQLTLAELRPLVDAWLAGAPGGASALTVTDLSSAGDVVSVGLEGSSTPPPATKLAVAISKKVGRTVTVSVDWRMATFATTPPGGTPAPTSGDAARATVETWLAAHPGVELLGILQSGASTTVDLAGSDPALVTPDLRAALASALGPYEGIVIRFARLQVIR
ncbi:MAG TPA: DUF389 domain-containing protein [Acidimicrobiales bacterium]|nr:DUF389 domain-containing protein [Acidimicrobiales bacterium]